MKCVLWTIVLLVVFNSCQEQPKYEVPNILFIMMDDLGYGQFAINNDTLSTPSFDPYFVELVNSHQDYTPEKALEFSKIAIPTMNKLAQEGIQFSRAFASSNLCAPSRLGIATGILQSKLGVYRNTDCEKRGLDKGSHLVQKLKNIGYSTAHIGKWHIGSRRNEMILEATKKYGIDESLTYHEIARDYPEVFEVLEEQGYYGSVVNEHHPLENGFDYYYGYNNWASQFYNSTLVWENYEHAGKQQGYNTDVFTDQALSFIRKQVAKKNPFYVQLHYHAVHDSLEPKAPDKYFNKFNSGSYDLDNFYAHVYGVDSNIKRITDYLRSEDILENTIIVFTSDNGAQAGGPSVLPGNAPFAGHKGTSYQGGFRVPLFIHWPKGITHPQRINELVSTIDILPTLIDAAKGNVPDKIDGKSLMPFINGQLQYNVHDHLVFAGLHARAWGFLLNTSYKSHSTERNHAPPSWVIVKGEYLLRFVGKIEPEVYKEAPEGGPARFELFNYSEDPSESTNLANKMPQKVQELTSIYYQEARDFLPPVAWDKKKWEEIRAFPLKD